MSLSINLRLPQAHTHTHKHAYYTYTPHTQIQACIHTKIQTYTSHIPHTQIYKHVHTHKTHTYTSMHIIHIHKTHRDTSMHTTHTGTHTCPRKCKHANINKHITHKHIDIEKMGGEPYTFSSLDRNSHPGDRYRNFKGK